MPGFILQVPLYTGHVQTKLTVVWRGVMCRLWRMYTGHGRFYHTLAHLRAMFETLDSFGPGNLSISNPKSYTNHKARRLLAKSAVRLLMNSAVITLADF